VGTQDGPSGHDLVDPTPASCRRGRRVSQHSGQRALRPRARLLRTLGTDLISSEKVALIELVKNAFDADASVVIVRFRGPLAPGEGSVEVWDDGHGMDVATLQTSWLDIATDAKRMRTLSESGRRRVLGEKGIGRLAAARLAGQMLLTTRRVEEDEVSLLIDWTDFDREGAYLDEIEVAWDVGRPSVFIDRGLAEKVFDQEPSSHWHRGRGTLLQLEHLSRAWTQDDFRDLAGALSRLVRRRPQTNGRQPVDDFAIILALPEEFSALSGEVGPPDDLRSPPYHLVGSVDETGVAQLRYTQLDPPIDTPVTGARLWTNSARVPQSGPFELDIEVWDRDPPSIEKAFGQRRVRHFRQLLDQVAGISLYRDGFRVLPFGEAGDDWLALDQRRVQNPTMRVSNNQVIGHVFIGADANRELRDQSNREGLLDGPAYEDLKCLIQGALNLIEARRWGARRPTRPTAQSRTGLFSRFELGEIRSALAAKYPADTPLLDLVDAKRADIHEGVEEVQRVLAQYSRLATLGSLIDRVLHDGRTAVARLRSIVRFGERDLAKTRTHTDEKVERAASALRDTSIQAELLAALFRQIEPFSGRKRGRPKSLSLRKIIDDAVTIFQPESDELGIEVVVDGDGVDVRVDPSEILTVLVNLLQNAIYWLSTVPGDTQRKIAVGMHRNDDDSVTILVSDSGPGVPGELHEIIFDAYFSSRPDGVGLGLSVAGNVVHDFYGGELKLMNDGPLPGATFAATLRRRV
jgi:signal transduction histidine kinase